MKWIFIAICLVKSCSIASLDGTNRSEVFNEAKDSTFVATNEWQVVREGQRIPAGLHVRINLETGKKEAKLLSESEKDSSPSQLSTIEKDSSDDDDGEMAEISESSKRSKEKHLRHSVLEALKNLKSDENESPKSDKASSKKFRTAKELKEDLKSLNLEMETDTEILHKLIQEYRKAGLEVQISIIEDLGYLTHQIDNAVNFINLGGIDKIVKPGLNATNSEIRKATMQLIGSASQSNPKVQIAFLEEGILSHLIRVVSREKDLSISSKSVFALSCIVRGFPFGQHRFVETGGLDALRGVLQKQDWKALPLQMKIISLIQDLLSERKSAMGERAQQLSKINLLDSLVEGNWCSAVSNLLAAASFDRREKRQDMGAALGKMFPLRPDHDMVDKVINTMSSLVGICEEEFLSSLPLLSSLEISYNDLAYKEQYQGDDGYEFFRDLASQINYLVRFIRKRDEL